MNSLALRSRFSNIQYYTFATKNHQGWAMMGLFGLLSTVGEKSSAAFGSLKSFSKITRQTHGARLYELRPAWHKLTIYEGILEPIISMELLMTV